MNRTEAMDALQDRLHANPVGRVEDLPFYLYWVNKSDLMDAGSSLHMSGFLRISGTGFYSYLPQTKRNWVPYTPQGGGSRYEH